MKQFIIILLGYLISKLFGIKNWIFILGIVAPILGCTKEKIIEPEIAPTYNNCLSITYIFKETKDTIIHWHKVCDGELYRYMSYPKESPICENDSRIQVLIISPDKCV